MFSRLSSIDATNTKVAKSEKSLIGGEKIRILSLSLMPDDILCPARNLAECADDCLRSSGRGIQQNVIDGRQARSNLWHADRDAFLAMLKRELHNFIKLCDRQNVVPVTRLNVLSDIPWENHLDFEDEFCALFSYDYTKRAARLGKTPSNYRLMFSYSKADGFQNQVKKALTHRVPITAVFRGGLPSQFLGRPVYDGDISDIANLEQIDSIIGLRVKGHEAKKSNSPFIIDNPELIARVS
jgi:hypothetical protein